ncbi:hypothetical protein [Halorarum halobium]|uniref:hypothetical protein n=1 Tax=Halorarum halobium TaxID=3075121 RepID=UPI0028A7EC23|nr:hypothetical protein [Halobaculum sp. XH14]
MSDEGTDHPPGVHTALGHLVADAREHAASGETAAMLDALDVLGDVCRTELREGSLRDRLLFGCSRVEYHADADPEVAVEYLRAMGRLLE